MSLASRMVKFIIFGLLVFWILSNSSLTNTDEILRLSAFIVIAFTISEIVSTKQTDSRLLY